MGESGQSLDDRPEAVEPQGIHGQAAERGHDPRAVALAVAMSVLAQLGVSGPVPGVFDRPAVADVLQQGLGCGAQTRVAPRGALSKDVVTNLIDGLPSRTPLQRTARIVGLPGQFSTTHGGAGVPRCVQVRSRPRLRSRLLAWNGTRRPYVNRSLIT